MGGGVACVMRAAESAAGALHKYFKLFSFHLTCKNIPRFNESEKVLKSNVAWASDDVRSKAKENKCE